MSLPIITVPKMNYRLVEVDGIYFPDIFAKDPAKRMSDIKNLQGRNDDVIIAAYPKAGTHWVWEIANMLLTKSLEYHEKPKEAMMMEMVETSQLEDLPSPRIFNTHLRFRHLPEDIISRKCKVIHVIRNPKDMAVSRYHHVAMSKDSEYSGTFHEYLSLYFEGKIAFGSWFDYTQDWDNVIEQNKDYPIHVMVYEDIKLKPTEQIMKLAEFLGVKIDEDFAKEVADRCSFTKLKDAHANHKSHFDITKANPFDYAFRKGTIGDWKNWFTVAEDEQFDALCAERNIRKAFIYDLPEDS
ncbi:hypothetical protein ACJMK2_041460 [Sinanodonta woodiana]|uniref:Sulfotransferase domain-containing protein n=1 Tax=Sinanodonta woodiana TaxID=1069815 RepID=A0ABD3W476_SINWO